MRWRRFNPGPGRSRRSRHKGVPLGRYIKHRRVRAAVWVLGIGVMLSGLIAADRGGGWLKPASDWAVYEGQSFQVTKVIDGDTIEIAHPDRGWPTTRVRLWGIDAPEVARPDQGRPGQPWSQESAELADRLCAGQMVRLRLEPHNSRGKYGRLLAYVELPGGTLLNEEMLIAGLAHADRRFEHRLMERFKLLELQAKRSKVGLWSRGDRSPKAAESIAPGLQGGQPHAR